MMLRIIIVVIRAITSRYACNYRLTLHVEKCRDKSPTLREIKLLAFYSARE